MALASLLRATSTETSISAANKMWVKFVDPDTLDEIAPATQVLPEEL